MNATTPSNTTTDDVGDVELATTSPLSQESEGNEVGDGSPSNSKNVAYFIPETRDRSLRYFSWCMLPPLIMGLVAILCMPFYNLPVSFYKVREETNAFFLIGFSDCYYNRFWHSSSIMGSV